MVCVTPGRLVAQLTGLRLVDGVTTESSLSRLLSRTEGLHLEVDFSGGNAGVHAGPSQRVRFSGECVVSKPVTTSRRAKPTFCLSGFWLWGSRAL